MKANSTVLLAIATTLVVFAGSGCKKGTLFPQLWTFPEGKSHSVQPVATPFYTIEYKNSHYVQPPVPTNGGGGHVIEVPLQAPFPIKSVKMYYCDGPSCNYTHECPNGTICPEKYKYPVEINGTTAKWHAWSNSGENCALFFSIE
jgi:hypothetical protein